jgi:hypothetical protein
VKISCNGGTCVWLGKHLKNSKLPHFLHLKHMYSWQAFLIMLDNWPCFGLLINGQVCGLLGGNC